MKTAPTLSVSVRSFRVTREQFITPQHYEGWLLGMPLRRHLKRRKKFSREEKEIFFRHHPYRCAFCPSTSLLTLDHIVPQILGGSSTDINLQGACLPCNVAAWQPYAKYLRALDAWMADIAA